MAHFGLAPGQVSTAMTHRTVEEIWYVLSGRGEMWRRQGDHEEAVAMEAGVCLTIPLGTHFQFRSLGTEALAAVAVAMPPWPGGGEARGVGGEWQATGPGYAGSGSSRRPRHAAGGGHRRIPPRPARGAPLAGCR